LIEAVPDDVPLAVEVPMTLNAPEWSPLERARRARMGAERLLGRQDTSVA
jgi:hypothetical protein